jgi:sec-independent protein translocase protein TatA
MFGLGVWELVLILLIVVLIFGANKLPAVGQGIGQAIKNFKKATNEPAEIDVTPKKDAVDDKEEEEKKED